MEGLPALTLWDSVIDVLELLASRATGDPWRQLTSQTSQNYTGETIDHVPRNAQESSNRAHVFMFDDNEPVMKLIIQGQEPAHTSCFHGRNV